MGFIFVFVVFHMLNGTMKSIVSPPVSVVENSDPSVVCESVALALVLAEKNIDKFDYACLPPPDFDSDSSVLEDNIKAMKKDLAEHSA